MRASVFLEMLGWTGAALVLAAYALLSWRRILPQDPRYQAMNVAGSCLSGFYALSHGATASAVVSAAAVLIGTSAYLHARVSSVIVRRADELYQEVLGDETRTTRLYEEFALAPERVRRGRKDTIRDGP